MMSANNNSRMTANLEGQRVYPVHNTKECLSRAKHS